MKLITFGDSWVWGDEISPCTTDYRNSVNIGGLTNRDYSFSDYINFANNGASNERIILQIMEYKNSKFYSPDDFLMIGLTSPSRTLNYLNYSKGPFTIPNWDVNHLHDSKYITWDDDFKKWVNNTGKYLLNTRNELVRYATNILTIKSLLSHNKKYLVWQSIDDIHHLYNSVDYKNWNDVILHYDENSKTNSFNSTIFFDKEYLQNEVISDLCESQIWINFNELSWKSYLENNGASFVNIPSKLTFNQHPSEDGIKLWYNSILKSYINLILKK